MAGLARVESGDRSPAMCWHVDSLWEGLDEP
jgi:hypothetical protein